MISTSKLNKDYKKHVKLKKNIIRGGEKKRFFMNTISNSLVHRSHLDSLNPPSNFTLKGKRHRGGGLQGGPPGIRDERDANSRTKVDQLPPLSTSSHKDYQSASKRALGSDK